MKSLSSVGLALSVVFGCLLLALVAELYYLLWWKNRIVKTNLEEDGNKAREFCYMFFGRSRTTSSKSQEMCSSDTQLVHEPTQIQLQENSTSDFWFKPFGDDDEIMGLCGPPRFLFTIKEETKEDMESEDGKSKSRKGSRTRSLSDLCTSLSVVETPFLTPLASPSCFTPPLSPINGFSFNPFLESASDAEFNKFIRSTTSSPPPTFQFLKDAEEKFCRRNDQNLEVCSSSSRNLCKDVEESSSSSSNGPFITLIFPKNNKEVQLDQHHVQQQYSSSSQVLPLVSSPPILKLPIQQVNQKKGSSVH